MTILKADMSHAEVLAELGARTFAETFVGMQYYTQEIIDGYNSQAFSIDAVREELADPQNHFRLLQVDGEWAGYLKVADGKTTDVLAGKRALCLNRIYLLKRFQRQGLGDLLLSEAFAIGRNLGYEWIWLTVWEYNKPAVAFYKKHSFTYQGDYEWAFELGGTRYVDIDWVFTRKI